MVFNSHNETAKWVLIENDQCQMFDTQEDADAVFEIGNKEDLIGSSQILPPNYRCTGCRHTSHTIITERTPQVDFLAIFDRCGEEIEARMAKVAELNSKPAPAGDFDLFDLSSD